MSARRWASKLEHTWLSKDAKAEAAADDAAGVEFANMPKCHRCTALNGRRTAVVSYEVAETGKLPGTGAPFVALRARCHGEEEVLRIANMPWPPPQEKRYLTAIIAAPFFTGREPEMLWIGDKFATKLWLPH